ncbi:hypothetical protein SM0020_10415 [Sinorhizobium meliloti CCNWSX0020]|uniref:Right handed beta helix domain-containing protein n=1 Tax=Sinorhizobium meliloti CCNWSX0020 TaxID=1107881 RepID=H0FY13_RHIML|nr:hypothetical protein [Sinorhizobium meliloti]EHK78085.1 hypothetical protein SM0020_10415 [Sinorhizobium meliloti CCNWSX0020]
MVEFATAIWDDGPSSDPYEPDKAKIRAWGTVVESAAIKRTIANVQAQSFADDVDKINVLGFPYQRASSEPQHHAKVQSADGKWFEYVDAYPSNELFKEIASSDTQALEWFIEYLVKRRTAGFVTDDLNVNNAAYIGTNNGGFPAPERVTIYGAGGKINSQAIGYTLTLEGLFCPRIEGVEFVGTSDADGGVYNAADPQTGIYLNHCSMPQVVGCKFSKFSGFPIWVDRNQPATRHQGAVIERNNFIDCPFDPLVDNQACIFLGDNGEYARIAFNTMENCPQFVRAIGGANSMVLFNIIMGSNVTDTTADNNKGLIFFNAGPTNEGKITVFGNEINHNETNIWAINIVGSGASDTRKNSNNISDNKILVHGSTTGAEMIRVVNFNKNTIKGNHLRSKNTAPPGYVIWLDNCLENSLEGNNFEEYGDAAVRLFNGSTVLEDGNTFENKATAYSLASASDKIVWRTRRTVTVRFDSAGALASGCDASNLGWSVSKTGTGTYTVTHNLGAAFYTVEAMPDGGSGRVAATRNANDIAVSVFNTSNAAVDAAVSLVVHAWDTYTRPLY